MNWGDVLLPALLSFLHFTALLIMAGALSAESFILRLPPSGPQILLLTRIDLFYGLSAGLLLLAGFGRVFSGDKPAAFYFAEPFFWAKLALFVIVGLISIAPTMRYIKWRRAFSADAGYLPPEAEVKNTRVLAMVQLHLLALIVLFAVLMSRGVGGALMAE